MIKKLFVVHILTLLFITSCNKGENIKPNILFIMSDDHAYQAISAYDDRLINTPNIDRLAKEGIMFTNACVTKREACCGSQAKQTRPNRESQSPRP